MNPKTVTVSDDQLIFQQKETARQSMEDVIEMFSGFLISIRGDVPWTAVPPTLLPANFSFGDTIRQEFSQKNREQIMN